MYSVPIQIRLFPEPLADNIISIKFSEKLVNESEGNKDKLVSDYLKTLERLSGKGEVTKLATEDISQFIGQPADMSISYVVDESGIKILPEKEDFFLCLEARVKLDYGYLEFVFEETLPESASPGESGFDDFVLERKSYFLNWLSSFLPAYSWTGENQKPESTQLATQFGYINLDYIHSLSKLGISIQLHFFIRQMPMIFPAETLTL